MTMRILGIDPGLRSTGFGIIDKNGANITYVASGTISTNRIDTGDLPARLKIIYDGIHEVITNYQPNIASVEIIFVNVNPQSTLLLGQARGACIAALVSKQIPVYEYTALQMKQAVVGYGRAHKNQIQEMVKRLLSLPTMAGKDASDALGLAITHAHSSVNLSQIRSFAATERKRSAMFKAGRSH